MQGRCDQVSIDSGKLIGIVYLVFLEAVLKYVLNDQAAGFAESNFMPHTTEGLVDILHDLGGRLGPTELE